MALTPDQQDEIVRILNRESDSRIEIILRNVESFLSWLARVARHLYEIIQAARAAYDVFRQIAAAFGF